MILNPFMAIPSFQEDPIFCNWDIYEQVASLCVLVDRTLYALFQEIRELLVQYILIITLVQNIV